MWFPVSVMSGSLCSIAIECNYSFHSICAKYNDSLHLVCAEYDNRFHLVTWHVRSFLVARTSGVANAPRIINTLPIRLQAQVQQYG